MKSAHTTPSLAAVDTAVRELVEEVRLRFYAGRPREFYRDRRMLLFALTWPGTWLERRGLTCPAARYRTIIAERLANIAAHGDAHRYSAYFPAYLLKCLQDWFERYGEDLYGELKHIRNALDQVLASVRFATKVQRDAQAVDLLGATHRLIRAERDARPKPDGRQLTMF